jgi:hypothetical protein
MSRNCGDRVSKPRFFFNIDTHGACNLRCPSCAVGNTIVKNPQGFMEVPLLERILDKAVSECDLEGVALFVWTEPFLHPKLPELIRVVNAHRTPCSLSTNLNVIKNVDNILAANPDSLRISLSGFYQQTYGITHRGGDIERVKANMLELANARERVGAKTRIHMMYHRYLGNLDEEVLMREYAGSLGFEFQPVWAFLLPLEKAGAYLDHDLSSFTEDDKKLMERLTVPLDTLPPILKKHRGTSCYLQTQQISMDFKADVQLCCAVYDSSKFTLGNYLDLPLGEIQKRKYSHAMCDHCIATGLHAYQTGIEDAFDEVALQRVKARYRSVDGKGVNFTHVPRPTLADWSPRVGWMHLKRHLRKSQRVMDAYHWAKHRLISP